MPMQEKRVVLVSALNWGIGHATRCIPVICSLIRKDFEVIIAGNGASLDLLKMEFPQLQSEYLPGVEITYGKSGMTIAGMMLQVPGFIYKTFREHRALNRLVKRKKIQIVISDNRYGLWNEKCISVFICHQINVRLPSAVSFAEKTLNYFLKKSILKFNSCWVPDTEEHALAAELSEASTLPVKYIGPLSRFYESTPAQDEIYEVLVVLSGPEPQRSILEEKLTLHLNRSNRQTLFVRGLTSEHRNWVEGSVTFVNSLPTPLLHFHLLKSKYIICRSGYSSLMDLSAVKRSAVIIPTPGQTEQEYLGTMHHMKSHFCMSQEAMDLSAAFLSVDKLHNANGITRIDETVEELLKGTSSLPVNA